MEKIGKILGRDLSLSETELATAAEEARRTRRPIGKILVLSGRISEEDLYRALAEQYALPFARISEFTIEAPEKIIPRRIAEKRLCFPLIREPHLIELAVADPHDMELVAEIEFLTQCRVNRRIASETDILTSIERCYGAANRLCEDAHSIARNLKDIGRTDAGSNQIERLRRETEAEPVVRMVSLILDEAVGKGASDIHLEPHENSLHIRYRIDGMLLDMMDLPEWMQNPLTSRVKILANLDIAEKRVPQDGRIKRVVAGEEVDLRVSTLPTHHGEKTVIRILRHTEAMLQLESLGLEGRDLERMIDLVNKPQGMLFVTGPTGSGKSSTIFACLNRIKSKAINITTIEDPIEYKLPGVNQVQINDKAGLTFADTLRSILRQDPDVILVGEIRDTETAQIALQASQTGHLVFSTLHTNDSISAITRLRDLGIPPFLVASAVLGVLAQRLVRVICPECKAEYQPHDEIRFRYKMVMGDAAFPDSFYGRGCKSCNQTGFKGRTGVFEFLRIDPAIRELITRNESENAIREASSNAGMTKLADHGLAKVRAGITSIEELLRVVLFE